MSVDGFSNKLNFFEPVQTEKAIIGRQIHFQEPTLISQEVIEISISGEDSSYYCDLANSCLKIQLRILDQDRKPITSKSNVGCINIPIHSIWNQVDFSIQNTLVSRSINNNYSYKAIIDSLLNYSNDYRETLLVGAGFFQDSPGNYNATSSENLGLYERSAFTKNGKIWELQAPMCLDEFKIQKYLPAGLSYKLKLWRNTDAFCLMHNPKEKYFLDIVNVCFQQNRVLINPAVLLVQNSLLKEINAVYNYEGSYMKQLSVTPGSLNLVQDNLLPGLNVYWLCVCLVDSRSVNGDSQLNPFLFEHCNTSEISFSKNSQQFIRKPFTPNFETGNAISEYLSCLTSTCDNGPNFLTLNDYLNGSTFFIFNQNTETSAGYNSFAQGTASYKLELKFRKAVSKHVTCIIYAKYHKSLQIDYTKNVYVSPS